MGYPINRRFVLTLPIAICVQPPSVTTKYSARSVLNSLAARGLDLKARVLIVDIVCRVKYKK